MSLVEQNTSMPMSMSTVAGRKFFVLVAYHRGHRGLADQNKLINKCEKTDINMDKLELSL